MIGRWRLHLGILLVLAGLWAWSRTRREPWRLLTATPRRGDVARVIREEARTRFRRTEAVSMPFAGRLLRHEHEEGDRVEAGEVLATLQEDLPEAALAGLREEVRALEAELRVSRDTSDEDAAVARAEAGEARARAVEEARVQAHEEARATLELAEQQERRLQELDRRGAATTAELDRVVTAARRARAALEAARAEARAARAEVAAAGAALAEAGARRARQPNLVAAVVARLEAARARLVPRQDERGRTRIESPLTGVLLQVHHRSETVLPAGAPLFEVGDPASLEVEVDLLSQDAVHLRRGAVHGVHGRALGGREDPVVLREVSARAFTRRSSLGVEEQRAHAWFTFRERPPGLGHGYRVQLRAALAVARDAWLVPRRALVRIGGRWGAFLERAGRARFRELELGVGDETWVEAVRGIEGGETLLLSVPEKLREGDPVEGRPTDDLPPPAPLPGREGEDGPPGPRVRSPGQG